jgi:hypothetical protein
VEIAIDLQHVFNPLSSSLDDSEALKILLDALIRLNLTYVRRYNPVPLYKSGVVYGRTTIWDPIPALYARGYGDCKSLSCALVAEYLAKGIAAKPVFRFRKRAGNGGKDFHILVMVNGERWEDPSRILGMGKDENQWFKR